MLKDKALTDKNPIDCFHEKGNGPSYRTTYLSFLVQFLQVYTNGPSNHVAFMLIYPLIDPKIIYIIFR